MDLKSLRKNHKIVDLFVELAEIPSPSMNEKKIISRILEIMDIYGIKGQKDKYGNIIAYIPPSKKYKDNPPVMLMSHMDVVGGSDDVNVRLSSDNKYIETDKKRTLGADNKAGIAAVLDLAIYLNTVNSPFEHCPIEIVFTRDEETGMSGVKNLDTSLIKSKYALVLDAVKLGDFYTEGASFTNVYVSIFSNKSGHSGFDIGDKTRINAIKLLTEFDSKIPNGAIKTNEKGVVTSINAAMTGGGSLGQFMAETVKEYTGKEKVLPSKYGSQNIMDTALRESVMNIIPDKSVISYSIRSSDPKAEEELLTLIKRTAKDLNRKYDGMANINVEVKSHLKPLINEEENLLKDIIINTAKKYNIKVEPKSFPAGADAHILSSEKLNSNKEKFIAYILGTVNLENIHSSDEKMDWKSLIEGRKWLEDIVKSYSEAIN